MSTGAVEVPLPKDLTPSEILLLRCDLFAPLPPFTLGSRIGFEWDNAFGYLIALFFSTALLMSADQISADHILAVRIVAALVCLGLPALWWYNRRHMDPKLERKGVDAVFPLGGTRVADRGELIRLAISAALLASEQRDVLTFDIEDHRLKAQFDESAPQWPRNSLEERLRRGRPINISELVHDWMGDGSNFPSSRAWRLIEHSANLRGLSAIQPEAVDLDENNLAKVKALLDDCQNQRPAIWKAMQTAITAGLESRTVPPTMEDVGGHPVPKFNYPEVPISSLDMPTPAPSDGAANATEPKPAGTAGMLVVAVVFLGATAFTLIRFHPENTTAALLAATGMCVAILASLFIGKQRARHRKLLCESYSLPKETVDQLAAVAPAQAWHSQLAGMVLVSAIVALPVAIWGAWTVIFPLGILGLVWATQSVQNTAWKANVSAVVVAARVRALRLAEEASAGAAVTAPKEPVPAERPNTVDVSLTGPLIPEQPTAAHNLPRPSAEIAELLSRWTLRRARFRRLYWISLGVLITGYTLIVLAFWDVGATPWINAKDGFIGYVPFGVLFTLIATGMALYWVRTNGAVEDESSKSRHGFIALLIAIWRVNILFQAPLLFTFSIDPAARADAMQRHPFFIGSVLLFLLLHWLWMEWAMARIMQDLPLTNPRRLVMLRVFGSPAFDDLVTLIGPWRRVGLIEHLEGYDTVGLRSDVQDAVDKGQVDKVLAKNMAEVQEQLDQASTEPDAALLYKRHAFQCTNATWRQAIQATLDRADAVLMDLSSLSMKNQGCAWELGQLLDRVPLANVTLLVNDSTDLECLRGILDKAAQHIAPDSPNRDNAAWQLIRIGGLSQRQPDEDYYGWKRRLDDRLDPTLLTAWLLSIAKPSAAQPAGDGSGLLSSRVRWARQVWWPWLGLLALSALWSFRLWKP
jgi:hypothetical protein